jgi:histone acetyltransferase 1
MASNSNSNSKSNPLGYRTPPNSVANSVLSSSNNNDDEDENKNDSTTNMNAAILSDEPKLSSAALCTRLKLQDAIFRPEFTHQCLPGEYVRGYQPLRSVLQQVCQECGYDYDYDCDCDCDSNNSDSNSNARLLHKSHRHHTQATKELDMLVTLAPSCRKCHVAMTIQKKKRKLRQGNRHVKRIKGGGVDEEEDDDPTTATSANNGNDNDDSDNESEFQPSSGDDDGDDDMSNPEGTTRTRRMPQSEISESIGKALPEMVDDKEDVMEDYLASPIGKILQEFSVSSQKKKNGTSSSTLDDYCMTLVNGTDANAVAYHNQVQKLALWFIENADESNVASTDSGGFWKVVYLFQKIKGKGYSLAGYITLFHFHAPFHKPEPGIIVRICQALVLPPYQRQGHGQRLMTCVYDLAHDNYSDIDDDNYKDDTKIVQINVEDPAPGFVALRNKVDYQLVRQHLEWFPTKPSKIGHADFFTPLIEIQAQAASALAKITPRQMHLCHELTKLQAVQQQQQQQQQQGATCTSGKTMIQKDDEMEKQFRLLVKKRLNKEHREEMSALPTKAGKQAFLAKLFDKELKHYELILRACQ